MKVCKQATSFEGVLPSSRHYAQPSVVQAAMHKQKNRACVATYKQMDKGPGCPGCDAQVCGISNHLFKTDVYMFFNNYGHI